MVDSTTIYSAMQEGMPIKSYIKTILGKVYVTVLNPFSDQPEGLLLEGDPKKPDDKAILDVWSTKQDVFLKNMNRSHFNNGIIKEYVRSTEPRERTIEEATDPELTEIVNMKFLGLQNKLNKITSTVVLFRILGLARDNEKSDKIIKAIEARISEVQSSTTEEKDSE